MRSIFIVFFILISYKVDPQWMFGENGDWFKIINLALFAFTNGYSSNVTACLASKSVDTH
jgi:hypothetical protein